MSAVRSRGKGSKTPSAATAKLEDKRAVHTDDGLAEAPAGFVPPLDVTVGRCACFFLFYNFLFT